MLHHINVIGINGRTVKEYWEDEGGPTAYLGTTMPGFPNFFSIFGVSYFAEKRKFNSIVGPNTVTGHASVIFTEEAQINYILTMIKPVLEQKVDSFEVKGAASKVYNEKIQAKLRNTVYSSCLSWYRRGEFPESPGFPD